MPGLIAHEACHPQADVDTQNLIAILVADTLEKKRKRLPRPVKRGCDEVATSQCAAPLARQMRASRLVLALRLWRCCGVRLFADLVVPLVGLPLLCRPWATPAAHAHARV